MCVGHRARLDSGVVRLHIKGMFPAKSWAISENQLALRQTVPAHKIIFLSTIIYKK